VKISYDMMPFKVHYYLINRQTSKNFRKLPAAYNSCLDAHIFLDQ